MSALETVRLGLVPTKRFPFSTEWAVELRGRTLRALGDIEGVEVITPDESVTPYGLVQNDDDATATIDYFQHQNIDGVVVVALDFADEIASATIAARLKKPVLLFATKEGPLRDTGERISDAFCGTLSLASALRRRSLPFVFGGIVWPEEERFHDEVTVFAGACAAAKAFLGARVGQVGVRPERFETVAYDEVGLLQHFGQKVVPIELSEVVMAGQSLPEDDERLTQTVNAIMGESTLVNVNQDYLNKAARLEWALLDFYRRRQLNAMAVQCWPTLRPMLGIMPCGIFGRLTGQGVMTACEVDVLGALDMIAQYHAARQATQPHFIDWTIQHRDRANTFLAWHCGNAPVSLRAPEAEVVLRNRWRGLDQPIPALDDGAGAREFRLRTGFVTLSRLVEDQGGYKMLITSGTVVEDDARERGSQGWVEVADLEKLYNTLIDEGFIHHASLIFGDRRRELQALCRFVGIKTVIV
ncbi:MAG: L-fucose/L-arabinose isomerase family protein [Chloroflexota bacterium]